MTKLLIIIGLSFLFNLVFTQKVRVFWTPYAFAYYVFYTTVSGFLPATVYYTVALPLYIACVAFLLNGFRVMGRRAPVFKSFVLFAAYFVLSSAFGNDKVDSVVWSLSWFVECVCVGYFSGYWIFVNKESWRRTLSATLFFVVAACVIYYRIGSGEYAVGQDTNAGERLTIDLDAAGDRSVGSNTIAAAVAAILPFPVLYLMKSEVFNEKSGIVRRLSAVILSVLAVASVLCVCLLIIKTGCRNAMITAMAVFVYFGLGKWGGATQKVGIVPKVILVVAAAYFVTTAIQRSFEKGFEIRFFQDEDIHSDSFGSGRLKVFADFVYPMTDSQRWVGGGASPEKVLADRYGGLGASTLYCTHNSGVHLFCQSGVVGCILFLLFVLAFLGFALRLPLGARGIALVMFSTWLLPGIGEAQCFARIIPVAKLLLGLAMALCDIYNAQRLGFARTRVEDF